MSGVKPVSFETETSSDGPSIAKQRALYARAAKDAGVTMYDLYRVTNGATPRDFHPENAREVVTAMDCPAGTVHLHQVVAEEPLSPFSDERIEWVVVDLDPDAGTVTMKDGPPAWHDERTVDVDEIDGRAYTPRTVAVGDRTDAVWGY